MRAKQGIYLAGAVVLVMLLAVAASLQNLAQGNDFVYSERHYTAYNNFVIFRQSFAHLLQGVNLYVSYPDEYGDYFKYSPAFCLLMAPFHYLPQEAGLVLWNISGCLLFVFGLRTLCARPGQLLLLAIAVAPELFTSLSNSQSNIHIAGLLLFCFSALEKGDHRAAALYLMITAFIKLFTLALLPLWLLYPQKGKAMAWLLVFFLVFGLSPALVTGVAQLAWQYNNWLAQIRLDHDISTGMGALGLLRANVDPELDKNMVLLAGVLMMLLPLCRAKYLSGNTSRLWYFCFLLVWMVLFNHKAESPTFIIVFAALAAYTAHHNFSALSLVMLFGHLVFCSLSVGDLVPYDVRKTIVEPYRIKTIFPLLFMLLLFVQLMFPRKSGSGAQELPGVLQG